MIDSHAIDQSRGMQVRGSNKLVVQPPHDGRSKDSLQFAVPALANLLNGNLLRQLQAGLGQGLAQELPALR